MISQAKRYLFQSEQVVEGMKNLPDFVCGICLNQGSSSESSKFVTCKVCAISVHQSCYNMDHIVASRRSQDQWICDSCIHGGSDMVCQFCPNQFGCMKETKCGRWVHVVCSRSILSNFLTNSPQSPRKDVGRRSSVYIQLDELNRKQYGTKECMLCDDRLVAKTGICVKCDAGLCKSSFHVTCAQKYGLLSRPQSSGDPCSSASNHGETYIVYCSLHSVEEQMKKRQKWFIIESKTMELRKQRLQDASEQEKDTVIARLKELRQHKERNQISYRPPRPPLEQVPRLLSSDAHFTRLLNRKAEKMFGITTEYPAMIIPKSTEIRKRHNVAPSLTTDFAAYFMDRELRLEEEKEHLSTSITVNQSLLEKEDDAKSRYNEIREKLIAAKNVKNDMKKEYESLKQLFNSIVDLAKVDELMKKGAKRRKSITPRKLSSPKEVTSPPLSPNSGKEPIPDADSIIDLKRCGICKGQEDQHLLVKCDVCLNWQHLGCLDPPLTQMPKRTKFALWQCSECANSSSSSSSESESTNRGSFICKDGRRATRRVRRVPEKLAIGFPDRRIRQTKEMIGHSKLIHHQQKKLRKALENIAKQQILQQKSENWSSNLSGDMNTGSASDDNKALKTQSTNDTLSNLPLGVSCDNYLSVAARMPIINQTRTPYQPPATAPQQTRKIIILKKAFPISNRTRPAGLVQSRNIVTKKKEPTATNPAVERKNLSCRANRIKKQTVSSKKSDRLPSTDNKKPSAVSSAAVQIHAAGIKKASETEKKVTRAPSSVVKPVTSNNISMISIPSPAITFKILPATKKLNEMARSVSQSASFRDLLKPKTVTILASRDQGISFQPCVPSIVFQDNSKMNVTAQDGTQPDVQKKITETPAPQPKVPEKIIQVCSVCGESKDQNHIVKCYTCKKNYHWECCDPPLKANPVSKFSIWECSTCVDKKDEEEESESKDEMKESGSTVTPEGRRMTSRKRKPPELFEPAISISNQQKIFKSIEKHKMKKTENPTTSNIKVNAESPTSSVITAARCRPLPLRYLKCNRIGKHSFNAAAHLLGLKGLQLSGVRTISIVQKRTGPNTSVISLVPRLTASVPSTSVVPASTQRKDKDTTEKKS